MNPYKIKQGDSLTKIAKQFGTTVQDILKANPNIKNPDLIFAGSSLNVPEQKVQQNDPNALQGSTPTPPSATQAATGITPDAVTNAPQIAQQAKPSPAVFTSQKGGELVDQMTADVQEIATRPKTEVEKAREAEQSFISESDQAFTEMQTNLNNALQGRIPLTTDEQADIDYIKSKLDSTRKAQEQLNKSIEGGTRILANITGGEFAPVRAQQMVQQAVQQGIDKLNSLDMDAAKALRDARTAIKDKNFKNLAESYKMVQENMKAKGETLTKIREAAEKAEKDVRDFNYQVLKDERDYQMEQAKFKSDQAERGLRMQKLRQEIADATMGIEGLAGMSPALSAWAQEYASTGKLPTGVDKKTAPFVILMAKGIQQPEGRVVDSLTGLPQSKLSATQEDGIAALSDLTKKIEEAKTVFKDINTGLIQGTLGSISPSAKRQIYSDMRNEIIDLLARARSGAALTANEEVSYKKKLPGVWSETFFLGKDGEQSLKNLQNSIKGTLDNKMRTYGVKVVTADQVTDDAKGIVDGIIGGAFTPGVSNYQGTLESLYTQ